MTPEELERERLKSAEALDRAVEGAHSPDVSRTSAAVLGPSHQVGSSAADLPKPPDVPAWKPPAPPDLGPVNESFRTAPDGPSGSLSTTGVPESEVTRIDMCSGISPRNGTPSRSASCRAPP